MTTFRELFDVLSATTESPGWWPGEGRFEMMAGAVLVQNTNWANVERSLDALRTGGLLDAERVRAIDREELAEAIRPSGFMTAKSRSLKELADWFARHDEQAAAWADEELRAALLAVRGVGAETADAISLYAYRRPVFIFDSYARRLLAVAGLGDHPDYGRARAALNERVHAEGFTVDEFGAFHGLIISAGQEARAAGGWQTHWPRLLAAARTP
ncbi:3-methyladenine DNA glycosylase [Propionibacterium australiense]|uniref:DNA-(Apurinic or apyrimidinic site) lyase n=1 Tax=Propionibacterium australiense TaxID=119981 RepID=A0A383SA00_9ACTN|nr:DNA-(apurinic or apyrimidinic site) lyase [Propionibacterium australiense]VEH92733.1 3-methyladenine DNA glycosylase [Propionibacterium australiense]